MPRRSMLSIAITLADVWKVHWKWNKFAERKKFVGSYGCNLAERLRRLERICVLGVKMEILEKLESQWGRPW